MFNWVFILGVVLGPSMALASVKVGSTLPQVKITGEDGGKTNGEGFDSSMISGKVFSLFYIDPDEKDANEYLVAELKKANFDRSKYGSVAVINLAATWLPNVAIESKLKDKQKEHPTTVYVRDRNRVLVKKWGLEDDAYNFLIVAKDGKVLFRKHGTLSKEEVSKVITLINTNL